MALGRRNQDRQQELFVAPSELPKSPGHVFYRKLNGLLADGAFDEFVEDLCRPFYKDGGRPGIPPGVYFRMLLVGYFEGIASQRGIAWRCSDSLSIREFLGLAATDASPDHSSLTRIRGRLPLEAHARMFDWVLRLAREKKLVSGQSVGVDSTMLEADAAMKSIVRRDTGEDYRAFLTRLMQAEGVLGPDETPTFQQLRDFDRTREGKTTSNAEWHSPSDPDARIMQMKDGTTHLAYKAEHAVDLQTGAIVAAEIYPADHADSRTLEDSVHAAETNLVQAGCETGAAGSVVRDVVADCGYHAAETIDNLAAHTTYKTYLAERPKKRVDRSRQLAKKQAEAKRRLRQQPPRRSRAVRANSRRLRGERGKRLQRRRSEVVERTFAHVCETGGHRRSWLTGIDNVRKRWSIAAAAHNLGLVMRSLFGIGTPRGLQGLARMFWALLRLAWTAWLATARWEAEARRALGARSPLRARIGSAA